MKVMLEDKSIVPKPVVNVWDKEMIKDIPIHNNINRSF